VALEQDELPSSTRLDFRARLDGDRMYPAHLKMLPTDFLDGINQNDPLSIRTNGRNYNVRFARVKIGARTDVFKYQLREEDWESLVRDIGLEAGMFVVFTKHRFNRLGLMAFDTDVAADERMHHKCLWPGHSEHFGIMNNTFYRRFSSTLDKQRLAIKANFLNNHPMHQHRKEKPERTNHVGIYGKWKQFRREGGFEHDKMLRIHYIGTARQLDSLKGNMSSLDGAKGILGKSTLTLTCSATPDEVVGSAIRPRERTLSSKALYKNVFPVPPGPSIKNTPGESASTCHMMVSYAFF
nr:hypothetical protein [Tanacetum cinerariifolium]